MMGMRMPETCSAVFKWQGINLRSCCILLVDSVENRNSLRHSRGVPFLIPGTTNRPVDVTRQCFTSYLDNSTNNSSPILRNTLRYLSLTSCLASLTLHSHHGWLTILPPLLNSWPIHIYIQTHRSLFLYDPVAHLTLFRLLHFIWLDFCNDCNSAC